MAKSIVIEVKNVTKNYTLATQEIAVLKDVSFSIHSGEYVMFFGPSGCGKSTLLNTISGLEPPSTGEILVRGESIYKKNEKEITEYRRSKIGIVFQSFNLLKSLTIQENVALPLSANGEPRKRRMERAAHLLELVGLENFLKRHPMELSGGQQQRVAISRALSTNPWIVIYDEPTGNLDSKSADEIMEIIARLNSKSKRTVLMVTHNPEYLHFPHRIIHLKDGKIEKEQVNRHVEDEAKIEEKDLDLRDIIKKEEKKKDQEEKEKKKDKEEKE